MTAPRPLRITHLIAPVMFGGGEALLTDMLGSTRPDLVESVITLGRAPLFGDALAAHGIECRAVGDAEVGAQRAGRGLELVRSLPLLRPLAAAARMLEPDVLHAHGFPPSLLGALPLGLARAHVYTHHYERRPPSKLEAGAMTAMFRRYDALTTVAEHLTERMNAYFPRVQHPFETLRIGLADRFFGAPADQSWRARFPPGTTVGVCVGRLMPTKNQELAIRAIGSVRGEPGLSIGLLLVGTGPDEARLRALVAELHLDDLVCFAGQVERSTVPGLLAGADFGVLPSTTEASSLAAAEMLAAGRPILALDIAPMRETIADTGVLASPASFAAGIKTIALQHQALAPGAAARGETFRIRTSRERWAELYRRIAPAG